MSHELDSELTITWFRIEGAFTPSPNDTSGAAFATSCWNDGGGGGVVEDGLAMRGNR